MATPVPTPRPSMAFVTISTYQDRPIFEISRLAELFIDTLLLERARGKYKLHGFLVMPNHVFLLLTPQLRDLQHTIAHIRSSFAERVASKHQLWERGFVSHPIRSLHDLGVLRNLLYALPVRANLTPTAELYPYSSAHRRPRAS